MQYLVGQGASLTATTNNGNTPKDLARDSGHTAIVTYLESQAPPDLVVDSPSVDNTTPNTGQTLTLSATVRNQSTGAATATTLRYYRSSDATISTGDTEVGTDAISGLAASGTSVESVSLTAPSSSGTYYYGACVESVSGETDTNNNCSTGVQVKVGGPRTWWLNRLRWIIPRRRQGSPLLFARRFATKARLLLPRRRCAYYRSSDATISTGDTEVGTDAVSGLSASGTSAESVSLTAPSSAGTYYYGACVESVSGETNTNNNCSSAVTVTVLPYPKVYWGVYAGNISRANLDGTGVETLVSARGPTSIALDVSGGKMYWTDYLARAIRRANLDGTGVETLVSMGFVTGIALDVSGGKMYWINWTSDSIHRANLNGSSIETLVTGITGSPSGLDLDVSGVKMYWSDVQFGTIGRSNLDGSNVETLVTKPSDTTGSAIDDVALDVGRGKMYWLAFYRYSDNSKTYKIRRSNLDGSNVETLVTSTYSLDSIALDLSGGKMYWTSIGVKCADLDGSNVRDLSGSGSGMGIALDLRRQE